LINSNSNLKQNDVVVVYLILVQRRRTIIDKRNVLRIIYGREINNMEKAD
jgi:hypothetical protein